MTLTSTAIRSQCCDRCGESVRASFIAAKGSSLLFLCGHHTRAVESALFAQGWTIASTEAVESVTV